MKSRSAVLILSGCLLLVVALGWRMLSPERVDVVVYKSATCGCCVKWADMMEGAGFDVESRDVSNLRAIKAEFGIGRKLQSCHTAIVDGRYVIEGHVPIDLVRRLLKEQPDIAGLAVPGMPIGSPGMEGPNPVSYDVLSFDEQGNTAVHVTVVP